MLHANGINDVTTAITNHRLMPNVNSCVNQFVFHYVQCYMLIQISILTKQMMLRVHALPLLLMPSKLLSIAVLVVFHGDMTLNIPLIADL